MTEMMIEVINSQCANLREHLRTANNRFDLNVWGLFYNIDISRSNIDPPQYRGSCNFYLITLLSNVVQDRESSLV